MDGEKIDVDELIRQEKQRQGKRVKTLNIKDKISTFLVWFAILVIIFFHFTNGERFRELIVGVDSPSDEKINTEIHIDYDKSLIKYSDPLWINIDGERYGLVENGDEKDFKVNLSPGKHRIFLETKTFHRNSNVIKFDVDSKNRYESIGTVNSWMHVNIEQN